ncbi:MAG: hypothetical protein ACR2OU_17440 [Thermomicrobiales bacterium]
MAADPAVVPEDDVSPSADNAPASTFGAPGDEPLREKGGAELDEEKLAKSGPGVCGCLLVLAPIGLIIWIVVIWFVLHQFR